MQSKEHARRGVSFWSAVRWCAGPCALLVVGVASPYIALGRGLSKKADIPDRDAVVTSAPIRVSASQDQSQVSSFALDFAGFGGVSSALITRTDLELEIDGVLGTARFLRYDQDIDALVLPGGISTGNIHVEVVDGSSSGTFDRSTGEFVTNETYAIYFDGDLSAYGLSSPVMLDSTSVGVANATRAGIGYLTMEWAGASQLANPFDVGSLIDFSYTCTLLALFVPDAPSFIELELVQEVMGYNLPAGAESVLLGYLNSALSAIEDENPRSALSYLSAFAFKVSLIEGTVLNEQQVRSLTTDAQLAMRIVRGPDTWSD